MFKHILENLNELRKKENTTHRKSTLFDIESSSVEQTSLNLFSGKSTRSKMISAIQKLKGG